MYTCVVRIASHALLVNLQQLAIVVQLWLYKNLAAYYSGIVYSLQVNAIHCLRGGELLGSPGGFGYRISSNYPRNTTCFNW